MKRRDLLKMAALAPVAFLPRIALPRPVSSSELLGRDAAKRLHVEITSRGIRIEQDKQVQFYRYTQRDGFLDKVEQQDHPFSATYAADDTSIFDVNKAVEHIADQLVDSLDPWGGDSLRFYGQPDDYRSYDFPEASYQGVILTAHRFIDAKWGRECTVLEVWAG